MGSTCSRAAMGLAPISRHFVRLDNSLYLIVTSIRGFLGISRRASILILRLVSSVVVNNVQKVKSKMVEVVSMSERKNPEKVVDKIADLLEERQGERRRVTKAPTYLNPALDRRKGDRREHENSGR